MTSLSTHVNIRGEITAIVVERFDRRVDIYDGITRVHQEDFCQALGTSPAIKYENEGGPGAPAVVELLTQQSSNPGEDVGFFLDALVLNWAISGSDAHAKNYALLLSASTVRLAPLYDLISTLPYPDQVDPRGVRLAMRVDGEYEIRKIERRHWEGLAGRCGLDAGPVLHRARELLESLPEAAHQTAVQVRETGLEHPVLRRLEEGIVRAAEGCLARLDS